MKSLTIFFFTFLPIWWASAQSSVLDKKITVNFSNVTLEEGLTTISKISETEFSYSDDVVPVNALVSLAATEQELKEVLRILLANFQIEYKYTNGRIIFRKAPVPLSQTVRGTLVDQYTHLRYRVLILLLLTPVHC